MDAGGAGGGEAIGGGVPCAIGFGWPTIACQVLPSSLSVSCCCSSARVRQ